MGKYRILHVITRLEKGGAPQALVEMVSRLSPNDFQVDLATGQTDDPNLDMMSAVKNTGLSVIQIPALRRNPRPIRDIMALWQLIRLIKTGHYNLVHTHTSKAGFLGRIAAKLCRVPAIVHAPHGTVLDGYFSPALTRIYAFLEQLTAPLANRIVCLTEREIAQYLQAHIGKPSQYTFIYNGINIQHFAQALPQRDTVRQTLKIPTDAILCITVGRLVPVKGQADLLNAFKVAHKANPQLHLLVVGDGELKQELHHLTQSLDLAHCVFFLGWRTDVSDLLAASDIFVLPSHNEGLGLVIIEAMACQLPVIATEVGGVPDVVIQNQTGLLVPAHDPDSLAQAIVKLSSNPSLRHTMGQAGYQRCKDHFTIEATTQKTAALYHSLLDPIE